MRNHSMARYIPSNLSVTPIPVVALHIGNSDSTFLNQRRQVRGAVSNESIYQDVSKFLIDALPECLRAELLAKKVTQRLATKESNNDLNIDLRDWTQRGELPSNNPYCTNKWKRIVLPALFVKGLD